MDKVKTEKEITGQRLLAAKDLREQAVLEYGRALVNLRRKTIKNPFSGVVVRVYKNLGESVYYDPVLRIVNLDPLKVQVHVPVELFGKIRTGVQAVVTPNLPIGKKSYSLAVHKIDKVIEGPRGTFEVTLLIPNPRTYLPSGQKCKILFSTATDSLKASN